MPEIESINTNARSAYLARERSVNIEQALREQKQTRQGGLNDIEVRNTAEQLGKNDFLKLLITQLTYQDPTAPVKDQQFIAQMAQFSSLEQMQNIAGSLGRLADRQAHELIGRYVVGPDLISGAEISGVAEALFYDKSGKAFLKVGGRAVALEAVEMIGDPALIQQKYGGLGQNAEPLKSQSSVSVQKKAAQLYSSSEKVIRDQTPNETPKGK